MLHQPRVLPQVETFMDREGNITSSTVREMLESAADSVVQFTRQMSK